MLLWSSGLELRFLYSTVSRYILQVKNSRQEMCPLCTKIFDVSISKKFIFSKSLYVEIKFLPNVVLFEKLKETGLSMITFTLHSS
jgi:hypothetical protein